MFNYDREKVDSLKEVLSQKELERLIKYLGETDENMNNYKQALDEKKFYTRAEITAYLNSHAVFSHIKELKDKTVYNNLLALENKNHKSDTDHRRLMSIVKRYIPKSELASNPPSIIQDGHKKRYSYYYVLCLSAIFKERGTKTFEEVSMDALSQSLMTEKEIHSLFLKYCSEAAQKQIGNQLAVFEHAIYLKQRKLKRKFIKIVREYQRTASLKTYLYNLNNADSYVDALRELIRMVDADELSKTDLVSMADMLTHRDPYYVTNYAKEISVNHLKNSGRYQGS